MTYRVLVTGSRHLRDKALVYGALDAIMQDHGDVTVVHGKNDSGADWFARRWCWLNLAGQWRGRVREEPHPADWEAPCRPECEPGHRKRRADGSGYCPAQGSYRNQEMADSGADICLSFYKKGAANRGTTDCVKRAREAGIPVKKFHEPA